MIFLSETPIGQKTVPGEITRAQEKTRAEAVKRTSAEAKLIAQPDQAEILGADKSAEIEEQIDQARLEFEQRENVYRDALNEARHKAQTEAEERIRAQARAQAEASLRAEQYCLTRLI